MPSSQQRIDRKLLSDAEEMLAPVQPSTPIVSSQQIEGLAEVRVGLQQVVESPCNGTCVLSALDSTCLGCFRTKTEIAGWGSASNEERTKVVQRCAERRRMGQGDPIQADSVNAGFKEQRDD